MQIAHIVALLNEAKSLNASMGKVAQPCFKCLWSDRTPECDENAWHKYDTINTKLSAVIDLLNTQNNDNK